VPLEDLHDQPPLIVVPTFKDAGEGRLFPTPGVRRCRAGRVGIRSPRSDRYLTVRSARFVRLETGSGHDIARNVVHIEDRNYRLAHCAGFAVFDPGGRIGIVAKLEFESRSDRPDFLVVRRGRIRRRAIRVPVEQVVEVDLQRRSVLVHGAPVGRIRWRQPVPDEVEQGVLVQSR
jgi:hypothetical protein